MSLRIPREDIPAIEAVKAIPQTTIRDLVAAINSTPPTVSVKQLVNQISERVPDVPKNKLEHILDMLYTLYVIRETADVDHGTFLDDLIEAIQKTNQLEVPKKDIASLRSLFSKLLEIDNLYTLSKAKRLQRDGERLFCTAKALSDIRPVFGADPSKRPVGAVVTHTLKLAYHEGIEHKEFHLVLDANDLIDLGNVIARALAKDRALRSLMKDAKLPDLE